MSSQSDTGPAACAVCGRSLRPGDRLVMLRDGALAHIRCARPPREKRPQVTRQPDSLAHTSFPRRRRRGS
ncbi:MAG: hypothetical protein RLZZ387_443 [Chloroflexota bacterium]|jgi:hypothetical protein